MADKKRIVVISGGTHFYLRPHLALSAPAYGTTGLDLAYLVSKYFDLDYEKVTEFEFDQYFTKMAGGPSSSYGPYRDHKLDTNNDVSELLDKLIADPATNILFMPVALCDFNVTQMTSTGYDENDAYRNVDLPIGKQYPRLKTSEFQEFDLSIKLDPADKLIHKVRKTRKDIFLVGFKTTTGLYQQDQFEAGLSLLKNSGCNLVLANDLTSRVNMVITPEQAKYGVSTDREETLRELLKITAARANSNEY
jgi:phosphopantothenoylcysteine synthetase/decarboxylase